MDTALAPIQIKIYRTVPFDRNYSHVVSYPTKTAQNEFFDMLESVTITGNFIPNKHLLKIPISTFDTSRRFSYMDFSYCTFEFDGRTRYFFIEDVITISPSVIGYQLIEDVWNTYYFTTDVSSEKNIRISQAFIEREHVDRWKYGTSLPIFHKDVVEDTDISIYEDPNVIPLIVKGNDYLDIGWQFPICIVTYIDASNIQYIIVPFDRMHGDPLIDLGRRVSKYNDPTTYGHCFSCTDIASSKFIDKLGLDPNQVASMSISDSYSFAWTLSQQTEEISGVTVTRSVFTPTFDISYNTKSYEEPIPGASTGLTRNYVYYTIPRTLSDANGARMAFIPEGQVNQFTIPNNLERPSTYYELKSPNYEPVMHMYPYIDRTIINWDGTRIHNIPDRVIFDNTNGIMLKTLFQSTGGSVCVYFTDNGQKTFEYARNKILLGLGCVVEMPTIDCASNTWLNYVNTSRTTDRELIASQAIQGALNGIANGLSIAKVTESPIGGVAPAITGIMSIPFSFANQEIKEKSIRNMSQSLLFDGTGDACLSVSTFNVSYAEIKCNSTIYDIAYDRYTKYGYNVNRIGVPDINSRYYFNYLKTQSCLVEGAMPDRVKREIENVFNNGTTIWHYNNEASYNIIVSKDCPYENIERSLL